MKKLALTSGMLLTASVAFAGGLDRSGQGVSGLFEQGMAMGFSFINVTPSVSGQTYGGVSTSNVAPAYSQSSAFFKNDVGNSFSYGLFIDQPFGADVKYPTDTSPVVAGSKASISTYAVTILGQYHINNNLSIYGGPRMETATGSYEIPTFGMFKNGAATGLPAAFAGYTLKSKENTAYGYAIGVAYEKPEIALRVSLTYNSAIEHKLKTTETALKAPFPGAKTLDGTMTVKMPQSVNLDFQTGVNPQTLVFGGIRWVKWSETELSPTLYKTLTNEAVVSYKKDTTTYTLGVGRKLTDVWSVAGSIGYEAPTKEAFSNLAPTDGKQSIGIAAIYDNKQFRVQAGLNYTQLGNSKDDATRRSFKDNTAMGVGVSLTYRY